jgi:bifunctional enzyme CysN/CysC
VEVFVDTPPEECRRRDTKGLYARGEPLAPGAGVAFEAPVAPDVVVRPGEVDGVQRVVAALRAR